MEKNLPECPVATTVQLIGSKWKLLILRNLLVRPRYGAAKEIDSEEAPKEIIPFLAYW